MRTSRLAAPLAALALLAAACSDDDSNANDSSATTAGEEPSGYVSEVDGVMEGVNVAIREVDATLGGTYAEQSALFAAFDTGKLAGALDAARDDAAALEPPEQFESDHEVFSSTLDEAATVGERVTGAIEDRDIVELAAAVAELKVLQGDITQQVSPALCEAVSPDLEEGGLDATGEALCVPVEEVGDSAWARATAGNARQFFIEVIPRIGGLEPSFTDDDTSAYLALIQPEVERILVRLAEDQSALEPPDARAEDHDELVQFFMDFGDLAGRITVAAEAGDQETLEELFAQSGQIVDAATASLSAPTKEIIAPMFSDF